jgi:hypothetical protein
MVSVFGWVCFGCVVVVVVLLEACRRRDETPAQTIVRLPLRFLPRRPERRLRRAGDPKDFVPARSEPGAGRAHEPGSSDLLPVFPDGRPAPPIERVEEVAGRVVRRRA